MRGAALAGLILACGLAGQVAANEPACVADKVSFLTRGGWQEVAVEIADTEELRAKGLMFRKDLAPGQGMLFIYPEPVTVSFWMRNTLIPLDIVFLDDTGTVRHVHPMAKPLDETSIPGAMAGDPAPQRQMVVELPGGDAARLGVVAGTRMAHPRVAHPSPDTACH